jgi:hypothetical protein
MKKYLIIFGVLLLVILVINTIYEYKSANELMKNSMSTEATITGFGGAKGACYIKYFYFVEGTKFEGSKAIASIYCKDEYVGIRDLEIIYAVEDHALSDVVDERFK